MVEAYIAAIAGAALWIGVLYGICRDAARWLAHRRRERFLDRLWDDGDAQATGWPRSEGADL